MDSKRLRSFGPYVAALTMAAGDQLLKAWSQEHLRIFQRVPLFGQTWLVLSRVLNRGLMGDRYSAIPDGFIEPYTRYFPSLVWAFLLGMSVLRLRRTSVLAAERWGSLLLLAGGVSNLASHWTAETVVDPLQIYIGAEEYLPFNLADIAIVVGMALVLVAMFRQLFAREVPGPDSGHKVKQF